MMLGMAYALQEAGLEDTEQTWHKVSYETWVMTKNMVEDEQKLWDYGELLHSSTCGACHMAIPAIERKRCRRGALISLLLTLSNENPLENKLYVPYTLVHAFDLPFLG